MKTHLSLAIALLLSGAPALAQGTTPPGGAPAPAQQLMLAVVDGRVDQVTQILAANPGLARQPISDKGTTALMAAVALGASPALVTALLQAGSQVDFVAPNGLTVLDAAIAGDQYEATQLLLQAGADPNKPDGNGLPPLFYAVTLAGVKSDAEAAKFSRLLIQKGADASASVKMPQGGPTVTLGSVARQLKAPQTAGLLGP